MCFRSYKNRKLKVKRWWVGARKRKKRAFFCAVHFVRRVFFNISVLSQCIVYWIHFQNIHTFTYQKTLLHTLLFLVFKIAENLQRILKESKKRENRMSRKHIKKDSALQISFYQWLYNTLWKAYRVDGKGIFCSSIYLFDFFIFHVYCV